MTLKFYNTLTKKKEVFSPQSKTVRWYICGPTVYDSPHIGHARTYVCFDTIRRVLSDYFGYDVVYVMNVTDVDDKIINKAKELIQNEQTGQSVHNHVSLEANRRNSVSYATKNDGSAGADKDLRLEDLSVSARTTGDSQRVNTENVKHNSIDLFSKKCFEITSKYENEFFSALETLNVLPPTFVTRVSEYMPQIEHFIQKLVDNDFAYESNGSVYFDTSKYRKQFEYPKFVDKSAVKCEDSQESIDLPVQDNHVIKTIPDKDLCSAQNLERHLKSGDVDEGGRLMNSDGCSHNLINPRNSPVVPPGETIIDEEAIVYSNGKNPSTKAPENSADQVPSNGEPRIRDVTPTDIPFTSAQREKKSPWDFALWKSRTTELFYPTKFGPGRPGWHIECSAMSHSIFDNLDIHSGGIDLKFPHHENEMAQNLANDMKIDLWLHTGHLHIDGLKMSKSLKNFITISEFLSRYTWRQVRFAFMLTKWHLPMTFSIPFMDNAVVLEREMFTFLSVIKSRLEGGANLNDKNATGSQNEGFSDDDPYLSKRSDAGSKTGKRNENLNSSCSDSDCKNIANFATEKSSRLTNLTHYVNAGVFDQKTKLQFTTLNTFKQKVHESLCDNIDTSEVLKTLRDLANYYHANDKEISQVLLRPIYDFTKQILDTLGLSSQDNTAASGEKAVLNLLSDYRDEVRTLCKKKADFRSFYGVSDRVRDSLKELGYVIEDAGGKSTIRKQL